MPDSCGRSSSGGEVPNGVEPRYRLAVKLETPRCPNCNALLEGLRGGKGICRYCGATIVGGPEAGTKTETRYSLVLRVGPSNRERVAALLGERLGPAEARSTLDGTPCEIEMGTDEERARALAQDLALAGARVDVVEHVVAVPLVRVVLESVGQDRLATIVAIRQHLDVGLQEARRLVDRTPAVMVESMEERPALALIAALEKAGARARVG